MPKSNTMVRTVTPNKVAKADPQMGTVLANIQSLLQQLQAMAGADAEVEMEEGTDPTGALFTPGSAEPSKVEGEEEEAEPEGQPAVIPEQKKVVRSKAKKAIIVGDPDASTGSGDAEERIEDIPEYDEDNVDDVAKAIIRMLTKGQRQVATKSSGAQPQAQLTRALAALTQALTTVTKVQAQQGQVLEDVLEGLGVTKGLEAETQRLASEKRPVGTTDNALVMKEFVNALAQAMGGNKVAKAAGSMAEIPGADPADSPAELVRKAMPSIALSLAQNAGGLWNPESR
jgi:hypothetical protein